MEDKKSFFRSKLGIGLIVLFVLMVIGSLGDTDQDNVVPEAAAVNAMPENQAEEAPVKPEPPRSSWTHSVSEDRMTNEKQAYASSEKVMSDPPMEFPYNGVGAWLGIGCSKSSEWAYIGFDEAPNLINTDTQNGYDVISARIKRDGVVENVKLTQRWGESFLHFESDRSAIAKIASSTAIMLELDWYGQHQAYFEFPLNGSSNEIAQIRQLCAAF